LIVVRKARKRDSNKDETLATSVASD
jgi:hypothetical protein